MVLRIYLKICIMSVLGTTSYYALGDVLDHIEVGGTIDFNEHYSIEVDECKAQSDKAWLLVLDDNEHWLPKSQIDYDEGDDYVDIPGWLLDKIIKKS